MIKPTPEPRLTPAQIAELTLSSGAHDSPEKGHCLLEVVSLFAGEEFGDHPECVDPALAEFGRVWNDGLRSDDEREQLKRYIPLLPGTNKGDALSRQRSWMAGDWLIRTCLPAWLDLSPKLAEHAAALRALAPVTDQQGLDLARSALDHAARDSDAARDAARDAAWAAARDAARDAAWAAARAAARDAAWAAARAASERGEPEYTVASAAATAVLKPVCDAMQASAHDLYIAMINAELRAS